MSLWTVFCQDPVSEKKQQIHVSHIVRGGGGGTFKKTKYQKAQL